MLEVDGVPTLDDVMGNFPSEERLLKGFVAVHECYQDIPCNPCVESCPVHANFHGKTYLTASDRF